MWYLSRTPQMAAEKAGGVTFAPLLGGWVTFTPDAEMGRSLGQAIDNRRDAIYLPTIQKTGQPVDLDTVNRLRAAALAHGLAEQQPCSGAWILSADAGALAGQAQVEFIWRFSGEAGEADPEELAQLAARIVAECNQDCVAFEVDGVLSFASASQAERSPVRYVEPTFATPSASGRLWVLDANDADALASIALLRSQGETVLVTRKGWGVKWSDLDAETLRQVAEFRAANPDGRVIGLEYGGEAPAGFEALNHWTIDGVRSSVEVVARELGVELTRYEQLVAANNAGHIREMRKLGANDGEVALVRAADRCAQGITPDDERQAVLDIQEAQWSADRSRVLVPVTTRRETAQVDRLTGQAQEMLCKGINSWDYYGSRWTEFKALGQELGLTDQQQWANGGADGGYWGTGQPKRAIRERVLTLFAV